VKVKMTLKEAKLLRSFLGDLNPDKVLSLGYSERQDEILFRIFQSLEKQIQSKKGKSISFDIGADLQCDFAVSSIKQSILKHAIPETQFKTISMRDLPRLKKKGSVTYRKFTGE